MLIAPPEPASARALDGAAYAEPVIEIEFIGRTRVRIPASAPAALAAAVVKALSRR